MGWSRFLHRATWDAERSRFDTVGVLDELGRDVRYGLRLLRRNPTFALVVLVTLAIGIGANATVFSVVNSVLLNPLPYPNADQLSLLFEVSPLDPMTYAAVALVLTLAAALASYVPARRASAVSPVEALTAE